MYANIYFAFTAISSFHFILNTTNWYFLYPFIIYVSFHLLFKPESAFSPCFLEHLWAAALQLCGFFFWITHSIMQNPATSSPCSTYSNLNLKYRKTRTSWGPICGWSISPTGSSNVREFLCSFGNTNSNSLPIYCRFFSWIAICKKPLFPTSLTCPF